MSATTATQTARTVELGRYATDRREQRIVLGRRIEGEVRVYDTPIEPRSGRTYLVEEGFESRVELAMLIRDYLRQAERLGCCPMSRTAVRRLIEATGA